MNKAIKKVMDALSQLNARRLWTVDGPQRGQSIAAWNTDTQVLIVHDYGEDGVQVYGELSKTNKIADTVEAILACKK